MTRKKRIRVSEVLNVHVIGSLNHKAASSWVGSLHKMFKTRVYGALATNQLVDTSHRNDKSRVQREVKTCSRESRRAALKYSAQCRYDVGSAALQRLACSLTGSLQRCICVKVHGELMRFWTALPGRRYIGLLQTWREVDTPPSFPRRSRGSYWYTTRIPILCASRVSEARLLYELLHRLEIIGVG